MQTQTVERIARYLCARQIVRDPAALVACLDECGVTESLFAIEEDCADVLGRFVAAVYLDFPATASGRRRAEALCATAREVLLAHIARGRVDDERAGLDEQGNGCLLAILADMLDPDTPHGLQPSGFSG